MLKTRLGAVAAAVLLSLTACSSLDTGEAGKAPLGTAAPQHHRHHAADSHVIEAAPAPHGFRVLHAPESGIQLAAPSDWVLVEADAVGEAGADAMKDYADNLGITPDQLDAMMHQVELVAVGTNGDSINVLPLGGLGEVPTNAAIRSQLEALHADVDRIAPVEVPAGKGRIAYYSLDFPNQPRKSLAGIFLRTPRGFASVTVATGSRVGTRHLVEQVLPTLQPIGTAGQA